MSLNKKRNPIVMKKIARMIMIFGLLIFLAGGILLSFSIFDEFERTTAEVVDIKGNYNEDAMNSDRIVLVSFEERGNAHGYVPLYGYNKQCSAGDTVDIEYNKTMPEVIRPYTPEIIPVAAIIVGLIVFSYGLIRRKKFGR